MNFNITTIVEDFLYLLYDQLTFKVNLYRVISVVIFQPSNQWRLSASLSKMLLKPCLWTYLFICKTMFNECGFSFAQTEIHSLDCVYDRHIYFRGCYAYHYVNWVHTKNWCLIGQYFQCCIWFDGQIQMEVYLTWSHIGCI